MRMKRVLRTTHSRQHGVGVLAVLIITAIIAGIVGGGMASMGAGGRWNLLNWLDLDDDDAVYTPPDEVIGWEWYAFGTPDAGSGTQINGSAGPIVVMPYTMQIVEVDIRMSNWNGGASDKIWKMGIYNYDTCPGSLVASSDGLAQEDMDEDNYGVGQEPWTTFYFSDQVTLVEGEDYVFSPYKASGSTGSKRIFISRG